MKILVDWKNFNLCRVCRPQRQIAKALFNNFAVSKCFLVAQSIRKIPMLMGCVGIS